MNYNLVRIKDNAHFSKILKSHKKSMERSTFLFISLWDDNSTKVMEKLESLSSEEGDTIYVVDSFSAPNSFAVYNTSIVPTVVQTKMVQGKSGDAVNKVRVTDYLPHVYDLLGIS